MSGIVNIVELSNSITNVTGNGADLGTISKNISNIQKMVNFSNKSIVANIISKYDNERVDIFGDRALLFTDKGDYL